MADYRLNSSALQAELARNAKVRAELKARAERVAQVAKSRAPVESGRYRDSIHVEQDSDGFRVVADDPKAELIEYGTRPHVIRARDAKVLAWPGAQHPVREIHHPGTPAYHVLGNAADAAKGD